MKSLQNLNVEDVLLIFERSSSTIGIILKQDANYNRSQESHDSFKSSDSDSQRDGKAAIGVGARKTTPRGYLERGNYF